MAEKPTATTMKAVVFDGPHKVSIQDRPVPKCEYLSVHNGLLSLPKVSVCVPATY